MKNRLIILVIGCAAVLFIRLFISLVMRYSVMSKNEYKGYCTNNKLIKRWFFINADCWCKNKYSKGERRVIDYKFYLKTYSLSLIVLHVIWSLAVAVFILFCFGCVGEMICDIFIYLLLFSVTVCFIMLACIENSMRRNYHKSREHRR